MAMKWKRQDVEKLVALIHHHECIYYVRSEDYLDRTKKAFAFNDILLQMQQADAKITMDDIKKKWKSLRTQFMAEQRQIAKSKLSGTGDIHVPTLWCFDQLSFLAHHSRIKKSSLPIDDKPRISLPESVFVVPKIEGFESGEEEVDDFYWPEDDANSPMSTSQDEVSQNASKHPQSESGETPRSKTESKWTEAKLRKEIELLDKEHQLRVQLMEDRHKMEKQEFEQRLQQINAKQQMDRNEFELRIAQIAEKQKMDKKEFELRIAQMTQRHELEISLLQLKSNCNEVCSNGTYSDQV